MAASHEYLGSLTGGRVRQYADLIGQIYYVDPVANTRSYAVPNGFEDRPGDTWTLDPSKSWEQWNNNRTGRAALINPNPSPRRTYLDIAVLKAPLDLLVRVPDSPEDVYRRPMAGILRFIFPEDEGYNIVAESQQEVSRADFCAFKILRRPGGTIWEYDFMLIESKARGRAWGDTEDHLLDHLAGNHNESKNCYGMIQIGLEVQFYKFERFVFSRVGRKMHLIADVHDVIREGQRLKDNPLQIL